MVTALESILAGYLLGSIPMAWLVAKVVAGQDLRSVGSGNVGVLNTAISVARWAGILVLLAEAAKGIGAVLLGRWLAGSELVAGCTLIAAVVGTRWSIWLDWQGGRGNTASMVGIALLSWITVAMVAGLWAATRLLTGTSFWATRLTFALLPVIYGLATQSWQSFLVGAVLGGVFLSTHHTGTDDHQLVNERWASLKGFLFSPRRRKSQDNT